MSLRLSAAVARLLRAALMGLSPRKNGLSVRPARSTDRHGAWAKRASAASSAYRRRPGTEDSLEGEVTAVFTIARHLED